MNEFEELIKNYNIKNKEDYDFLEKVKNIIERKDNIIKEVREMINKLKNEVLIEDTGNTTTEILYAKPCCRVRLNKIEEILDKENKDV